MFQHLKKSTHEDFKRLAEEMNRDKDSDVLCFVNEENGFLSFYCHGCKRWHYHGKGKGSRVSHCINPKSLFYKTGYHLLPRWLVTDKIDKLRDKDKPPKDEDCIPIKFDYDVLVKRLPAA